MRIVLNFFLKHLRPYYNVYNNFPHKLQLPNFMPRGASQNHLKLKLFTSWGFAHPPNSGLCGLSGRESKMTLFHPGDHIRHHNLSIPDFSFTARLADKRGLNLSLEHHQP